MRMWSKFFPFQSFYLYFSGGAVLLQFNYLCSHNINLNCLQLVFTCKRAT